MKEAIAQALEEITDAEWEQTPASVKRLLELLLDEQKQMGARLKELEDRQALLKERVEQHSQNSSRPPSKDGLGQAKPPAQSQSGQRRGGQKGHPKGRPHLYEPEQCCEVQNHKPQVCSCCGAGLSGADPTPERHQFLEIPPIQLIVIEHRLHELECEQCGHKTRAPLPEAWRGRHYGERLSSVVSWLSGCYRQSHRMVQQLLEELFGVHLSTGQINRLRQEMSQALEPPVAEVQAYLQQQNVLGSDETSYSQHNGDGDNPQQRQGWLWVLVSGSVAFFALGLSRSQAAAQHLIGEGFKGIVISDRYGAYNWLDPAQRQVCWAHLKRDFTAMAERAGASAEVGRALLRRQRRLFRWWHRVRDGTLSQTLFMEAVKRLRQGFKQELEQVAALTLKQGEKTPWAKTVRTCRQLLKLEVALWTFVFTPGVEPTNNACEQALRPAVIWRRTSLGTQSHAGSAFVARMLTVKTTLERQQRGVLDFLVEALRAARQGLPSPSLLPN